MPHVNVGAFINGKRVQTKKALTDALRADPKSVRFDRVPNPECKPDIYGDELPDGEVLSVAMPCPWIKRRKFALVLKGRHGIRVQ